MNEFTQDGNEFLPLRDVVVKTLRKKILTGEMKPGARLSEVQISNQLGVSRTPVREALRVLEQEGLVVVIPRHGVRVSKITEKNMSDALEVREALEALCAELACTRITDEGKNELRKACEAFERAVKTNDSKKIAAADVAFHELLIKAAKNDKLSDIEDNLSQTVYRYRLAYINGGNGHKNLVDEHREIYENVINGNAEMAAQAARKHIQNQKAAILQKIHEEEAADEKRG